LFHFETKYSHCFCRKSAGQVVMKSSRLFLRRFRRSFTVSLVAKPAINVVYDLHWIFVSLWFHQAIFLKRPCVWQKRRRYDCRCGHENKPISPGCGNKSMPWKLFLWGYRADRKLAVKTLTNEASIEGRFRFAGKKPDL